MDKYGNVEFDVHCKMKARWVPYFLAMLKRMQANGEAGHSSILAFYADGDGDFRPKFESSVDEPFPHTRKYPDCEVEELFDAG